METSEVLRAPVSAEDAVKFKVSKTDDSPFVSKRHGDRPGAKNLPALTKAHLRQFAVRELGPATGAALMATVARITRAVGHAFPNEGLSLWHSISPAACQ